MLELFKVSFILDALGDSLPTIGYTCNPQQPCVPTGECFPMDQGCFPGVIPCEPDLICTPTILPDE